MTCYVFTFASTHAAMAACRALTEEGKAFSTIPVPTSISAGCGIAVKFDTEDPNELISCVFASQNTNDSAKLYLQLDAKSYIEVELA